MVNSQIEEFLKELLLEKGSAVLPGFGRFQLSRQSAQFLDNYGTIAPPSYSLTFDSNPEIDDNSLSHYIALSSDNVDESGLQYEIANYGKSLHEQLISNNKVEINDIGTIEKMESGLKFFPNSKTQNWFSFGLPEIKVKPLVGRFGGKPEAVSTETLLVEKEVTPKKSFGFWVPFLLIVAAIVALLWQHTCTTKNNISVPKIVENVEKDTSSDLNQIIIDSNGIVKNADGTYSGTCIIIVGSFKEAKNILRMEEKLASKGLKVFKQDNDSTTRIGFTFNCESEDLVEYIHKIRAEVDKGAWMLQPQLTIE